jgi:hypothetical protein
MFADTASKTDRIIFADHAEKEVFSMSLVTTMMGRLRSHDEWQRRNFFERQIGEFRAVMNLMLCRSTRSYQEGEQQDVDHQSGEQFEEPVSQQRCTRYNHQVRCNERQSEEGALDRD